MSSSEPPDDVHTEADRAQWGPLLAKYRELADLRGARRRGEPPPAKEVFVRIARAHPGALFELDTLPDDEIEARLRAVTIAAEGGEVAPWMRWMVRYHELVARTIAARGSGPAGRGPRSGVRASVTALRAIAAEEGVPPEVVSIALFGRKRRGI